MKKIKYIGELYVMVLELFVEVVCPRCGNLFISTMNQAEFILIFGCYNCADIDKTMITQINIPDNAKDISAECMS